MNSVIIAALVRVALLNAPIKYRRYFVTNYFWNRPMGSVIRVQDSKFPRQYWHLTRGKMGLNIDINDRDGFNEFTGQMCDRAFKDIYLTII